MTDAETLRASYRKVISSDPPWWVVTFYAPSLPPEGVSVRRRTLAEANDAFWNLYQDEFRGSGVAVPDYDFGPETDAKYAAYAKAHMAKLGANTSYALAGEEFTSALASQHQATLREMASILHESYWRVSRLQADCPLYGEGVCKYVGWIGAALNATSSDPYGSRVAARAERWAARSFHAAEIAGRQARIIAADVSREARRRYARRADS